MGDSALTVARTFRIGKYLIEHTNSDLKHCNNAGNNVLIGCYDAHKGC